jgi:cell cycle checkpoint protein
MCLIFFLLPEIFNISSLDLDPFPLKENLRRNSLKMEVPEKILSQAHGKVRTVVDFLYENGK